MPRNPKDDPLAPIDHAEIIDGFDWLRGFVNYLPFDSFCGICDAPIHVTSAAQKHLCEVKKVPIKFLRRGALFCAECKERRARINQLRKGDCWRTVDGGRDELDRLVMEETHLTKQSRQQYLSGDWPYGSE